jgi:hypothetical protein
MSFYVALLHEGMHDKSGKTAVTTSITPIDIHDIARSCRTFGVSKFFVAHPSPVMRKLARTLTTHWTEGFGSEYNPNRTEAVKFVQLVEDLDEAISNIFEYENCLPVIIATSAQDGINRQSFSKMREDLIYSKSPHLLLLGTGWGMNEELLNRASIFLEPIRGVKTKVTNHYNHLSVRAAAAIILERLLSPS